MTEKCIIKKEQDKTPKEEINEVKISNLQDKLFRVMIIKVFEELGRGMDKQEDIRNFNKVLER